MSRFELDVYEDEIQCRGCMDVIYLLDIYKLYKKGFCRNCYVQIPSYVPKSQRGKYLIDLAEKRGVGI